MVASELVDRVGLRSRLEVGEYVGPAEAVDRLLRVADEKQRAVRRLAPVRPSARRLPRVDAVEDAELRGVGVLELVDERDRPARPQPRGQSLASGPLDRVEQVKQQVVVGLDSASGAAPLDLARRPGEQPLAQLDLPASKRLHLPDQLAAEVEQREVGYDPLARDRLEMLAVESLDLREEVEADRVPREGPCGRIEE